MADIARRIGKGSDFTIFLYRLAYLGYVLITPVFLQYIMLAPKPKAYTIFRPVPSDALFKGNVARLNVNAFPGNEVGEPRCTTCGAAGSYNWKTVLEINDDDRRNPRLAHYGLALHPVLFLSQDFDEWVVVSDGHDTEGYIGRSSSLVDVDELGCHPELDRQKTRLRAPGASADPTAEVSDWSLQKQTSKEGEVSFVACVVQNYTQVEILKGTHGMGIAATNHNMFENTCVAIGSVCGPPCSSFQSSSPSCDSSTDTIKMSYLVSQKLQNDKPVPDVKLHLSHQVTIQNRKYATKNALRHCSPCQTTCNDADWQDKCIVKNEYATDCDYWKLQDGGGGGGGGDNPNPTAQPPGPDEPTATTTGPAPAAAWMRAPAPAPLSAPGASAEANLTKAEARRLPQAPSDQRWSCHKQVDTGLQLSDLFVQATLDPLHWPDARHGGLYAVILAGTNLTPNTDVDESSPPQGNWTLVWAPYEEELMRIDTNVTSNIVVTPEWCYSNPGFIYMVGCLTPEKVTVGKSGYRVPGPPFNDRCVAVGGSCGASCGSSMSIYSDAKDWCPFYNESTKSDARKTTNFNFLNANATERKLGAIPLATSKIPHESLVWDIAPLRSSQTGGIMFHLFLVCMVISFVVTATTYFPGCFKEYFPTHTWEELKDHSYIMDEFNCMIAFGVSKGEQKFFVMRNWLGKLSAVPRFQDKDGAVFRRGGTDSTKWCDVFADEGHREGARQMFTAWCTFLQTDPDVRFIEAWAKNVRYVIWEEAEKNSACDLSWVGQDGKIRPILPVTPAQAQVLYPNKPPSDGKHHPEEVAPNYAGVELDEKQLKGLVAFKAIYDAIPKAMKEKGKTNVNEKEDCVLTFPVDYAQQQVYLIYCARGNPEADSIREHKTRRLEQYHWACLSSKAIQQHVADNGGSLLGMGAQGDLPTFPSEATSGVPALDEEIVAAVNKELENPENEGGEPAFSVEGTTYHEIFKKRAKDQSLWEKCRFCYGKIVSTTNHRGVEYVLLDDVSNAFHHLMSSEVFVTQTQCGYPRADQVERRRMSLRRAFKSQKQGQTFGISREITRKHRIISVPKKFLDPFFGVRGKAGAMNFVVDLLRQRNWIFQAEFAMSQVRQWENQLNVTMPAQDLGDLVASASSGVLDGAPPKPRRYALYGIFDVRHQPHNDFWCRTMPAFFFHNNMVSFDYEVNDQVALVQAPQSFAAIRIVDDYLDVNNGLLFNMMNIIRNCVGGVTSCGTNGVWLIDTTQTWSEYGYEFFDSRTKIEDTASSHRQFILGKRSVYVHETVATGIAKMNAAYLGATQRWAEGAVQCFWVHFLVDRCGRLWRFMLFIWFCYVVLFSSLYCPPNWWPFLWCCLPKDLCNDMCWCLRGQENSALVNMGGPWVVFWPTQWICDQTSEWYKATSKDQWADAIYLTWLSDLTRFMDFLWWWSFILIIGMIVLFIWGCCGRLPGLVRTVIMFENCSYFWSSWTVFVWVGLSAYMVIFNQTPFKFKVVDWMGFSLIMQGCRYVMQQRMRMAGNCDEMSIWRSQQMFFVTSPTHIMSLMQGTAAAYGIAKHGLDKSFWSATDHGQEVVNVVKMWTGLLLGSAAFCLLTLIVAQTFYTVGGAQWTAMMLLAVMAITVWTPVVDVWGGTRALGEARKKKVTAKEHGYCAVIGKYIATGMLWGRSKSFMLRWVIDLGLPIIFLIFSASSDSYIGLAAYSSTLITVR